MPERCPLVADELCIGLIPSTCSLNCQAMIDKAVRTDTSEEYYVYPEGHNDCKPGCDIGFVQESIHRVGLTATRRYIITDECSDCRSDFGEQGFEFECPYN